MRGAWGAGRGSRPGLGWAGRVPYGTGCGCGCGCGCGLAVLVGRTGRRASSFEGPWPLLSMVDGAGREVANSSCDGGGGSSSVDRRNGCGQMAAKVNGSGAVSAGCAVAGLELVAGAAALQAWPSGQQLAVFAWVCRVCVSVCPCV